MKKLIYVGASVFILGAVGCNSSTKTQETTTEVTTDSTTATIDSSAASAGRGTLTLTAFDNSPKFPDAKLQLTAPAAKSKVPMDSVSFAYTIGNFQLTAQTEGGSHDHANSKQGQHIHNIVDNEPYTAHYKTNVKKSMKEGSHVVLSFLSRSFHESLKHKAAYDLRVINVGNSTAGPGADFNPSGQHLFYSRPKGEYVGADTKKVMLDFYLVNTNLAADGSKVRATINGQEFMIDKWQPHTIEGLPMGENTIKLELLDKSGTVIPGPFNTVERKITLKAE